MAKYKTINLEGAEVGVKIDDTHCDIRNDGTDTVYASCRSGVVPGADGVVAVPPGQAAKLLDVCVDGMIYLHGTGSVQLCGNDYGYPVFRSAAPSSGGGGEMSSTVLYEGAIGTSSKSVTLTDNVENYDIVVVTLNNMIETITSGTSPYYFYDCGNFVLFPNIVNTFSQNKGVKMGTLSGLFQTTIQGNIVGNKLTVIGVSADGTSKTKGWQTSDVKVIGIKLGG